MGSNPIRKGLLAGRAMRDRVPRASQGEWNSKLGRRDPIAILEHSGRGRLPELTPIRYGRMVHSPFTFLRGSAAVMAHDLALTPSTGLSVQACGDCHLLNFGLFATPERHLVFDLNDFDETHPAPWEWDLKRLAASLVVAARDAGQSDADARDAVRACMRAYREHMDKCASLSPLEIWYERLDWETIIERAPNARERKLRQEFEKQARRRVAEHLFPKICKTTGADPTLLDQPPLVFHVPDGKKRLRRAHAEYQRSLPDDRRLLFDRYRLVDAAVKVVGIGSVGTRCFVALYLSEGNHPLLLQFKEARRSVLEPYTKKSVYKNQGERVVMGQRLMQSSSDIFLGWVRGDRGFDFYVRQLRDMKASIPVEHLTPARFQEYAGACGWTLARAHAKSGDSLAIGGYLGKGDRFDLALCKFAVAYADQTERDHAALEKAVRSGKVQAVLDE